MTNYIADDAVSIATSLKKLEAERVKNMKGTAPETPKPEQGVTLDDDDEDFVYAGYGFI
jgi:hypothetical protein